MRQDLQLLQGAIDTHSHTSPSLFPRICDHVEYARAAAAAGMRAVVFKFHHGDTSGRIPIIRQIVGDEIEVYGGITLNNPVGGFNPFAVDTAIRLGAKMVWMPTLSAKNHLDKLGAPHFPGQKQVGKVRLKEKPLTIFADEKRRKILPEVRTICRLIAGAGICLSTGHLDPGEVRALIEHLAIFCFTHWGAYPTKKDGPPNSVKELVKMIRAAGPAKTILATDLGQIHNSPPWEGLRVFVQLLLEHGVKPAEIDTMIRRNPAKVLGLRAASGKKSK